MELKNVIESWLLAKETEKIATEKRRLAEDRMLSLIGVPENLAGTHHAAAPGYRIKITGRIDKKVDADLLQQAAQENDLMDVLSHLFRWKAEINSSAWSACSDQIKSILAPAITSKPGRPSFNIEKED